MLHPFNTLVNGTIKKDMVEKKIGQSEWKLKETLAIINENKEKGEIVEARRTRSVGTSKHYKWKGSYVMFGLEALKLHCKRTNPKARKLANYNKKNEDPSGIVEYVE